MLIIHFLWKYVDPSGLIFSSGRAGIHVIVVIWVLPLGVAVPECHVLNDEKRAFHGR